MTRRKGMMYCCLSLLVFSGVMCKDASVESNAINHDQDDAVLKAMKSSGVVDDMERKLSGGSLAPSDFEMLVSFINEYKADNQKEVTNDYVVQIVEKVVRNRKPNIPQILVQLGPIIDNLHILEQFPKSIKLILATTEEVLTMSGSIKEVFSEFNSQLKKEILKQQIHNHGELPNKNKKKPAAKNGLLETIMQEFFKSSNPMELMSVMNGDMSQLSKILGNTDLLGIMKTVLNSYFESSPYGPLIQQYGNMFLESDQGKLMMEGGKDLFSSIAESNSGQRLLKLAPQLMASRDMQTVMEVLGKEVEYNWRLFFSQLLNSSYKKDFVGKISEASVKAYDYIINPPKNSPLNQLPIILNGVLMSYKLPAFDKNNPAKTVSALVNKSIKLFTPWKVDAAPVIEQTFSGIVDGLSKHVTSEDYSRMLVDQKVDLVAQIIELELVQPCLKVWDAYTQAADNPKCATNFLCEVNRREKLSESKKTGIVKAASYAAAWTLSKASQEKYWKLYHAVNAGVMGADCQASYPNSSCSLREGPQISHNEL